MNNNEIDNNLNNNKSLENNLTNPDNNINKTTDKDNNINKAPSSRVEKFLKGNKPRNDFKPSSTQKRDFNFNLRPLDEKVTVFTTSTSDGRNVIRQKFYQDKNNQKNQTELHEKKVEITNMNISVKDLYDNACQFGHKTEITHPKMRPYIYGTLDGRAIINLDSTLPCLQTACKAVFDIAAEGGRFLFVGTKSSISATVEEIANSIGAHYVTKKWKPGQLTNFMTINNSLRETARKKQMIEGGKHGLTKKEVSVIARHVLASDKESGGILTMRRLPSAIIIVDNGVEHIAVAEAKKLKIPIIAIIDTNNNPLGINYPIYSNDDSVKPVEFLLKCLASFIVNGLKIAKKTDKIDRPERDYNRRSDNGGFRPFKPGFKSDNRSPSYAKREGFAPRPEGSAYTPRPPRPEGSAYTPRPPRPEGYAPRPYTPRPEGSAPRPYTPRDGSKPYSGRPNTGYVPRSSNYVKPEIKSEDNTAPVA